MKKRIITIGIIIIIVAALFVPIPQKWDDGGTETYSAFTYKIVKWNRLVTVYDEEGIRVGMDQYTKTSVYWFPASLMSLEKLWEIENQQNI